MSKVCKNCGAVLDDDVPVCYKCGEPYTDDDKDAISKSAYNRRRTLVRVLASIGGGIMVVSIIGAVLINILSNTA